MTGEVVRVLVVDDHPALRLGVRVMLEDQPDLRVVGEADGVDQALRLLADAPAEDAPDVVLLDLNLGAGPLQGVDLVQRLAGLKDAPAVLVFSAYSATQEVLTALDAGATGVIGKEAGAEALVSAVRSAARGESVLGPATVGRLLRRMRGAVPVLSRRESEVLRLLVEGLSNRQISARLFISEATAKSHLTNIYAKLGVESRGAAVAVALREGLLRVG
ncbi:response regulator [Kitasatospora sp. HPMI-4]|uniref:response regulator n=1 Tax=Kitasatospora sp. HPMI-4 TaxID=3448443 RepID=UPI003F1A51C4